MKVTGPAGTTASSAPRSARPTGGFALPQTAASAAGTAAGSVSSANGLSDISSLMALQGVPDPLERRRRAIRRGSGLLDRLDELKLALLAGEAGESSLDRLSLSLREARDGDDDVALSGLLDQIDLRAAVELAKAEVRRTAI